MARMIGELERDPESGFPGKVGRLVATKDEESARERIAAPAP